MSDPIAHGYETPENKRDARRAGAFAPDPILESAKRIRDTDPAGYDRLSPSTRISLGYYESAKRAAEAAGIDTTDTTNPNGDHAA